MRYRPSDGRITYFSREAHRLIVPSKTQLIARIQMLRSGARGWVDAAETMGLNPDAIGHVREAQKHARQALEILDSNARADR